MAMPEWARVCDVLQCGMPDGLSLGYFMRLQDCSAKEFECYHDDCGSRVYARAGDIPFQQRRKYKTEIDGNQPVPGEGPLLPPLSHARGVGPCDHLSAASGTWVAGPDMLTRRMKVGLAVHNGELLAIGGFDGTSSCERLDVPDGRWVSAQSLPEEQTYCLVNV